MIFRPPPPGVTDYYSGLEDDSSEESDADSSGRDDLMDFDLEENTLTGFAVASHRCNSEFHELFHNVPEMEKVTSPLLYTLFNLFVDYGCVLQRETLIQGHLYISENHICFHANIFGWITDFCQSIVIRNKTDSKNTSVAIK